jgi:hypothetical protein
MGRARPRSAPLLRLAEAPVTALTIQKALLCPRFVARVRRTRAPLQAALLVCCRIIVDVPSFISSVVFFSDDVVHLVDVLEVFWLLLLVIGACLLMSFFFEGLLHESRSIRTF